jgi:hypothetical protein
MCLLLVHSRRLLRRPVSGPEGTMEVGNPRASKITLGAAGVGGTPRLRVAGSLVDSTSVVRGSPAESTQLYGSHLPVNLDVDRGGALTVVPDFSLYQLKLVGNFHARTHPNSFTVFEI